MKRDSKPARVALALPLGLCLWVADPVPSPASLILDNARDVYLDPRNPALLHAPLPAVSEACETPASRGAQTASLGRPDPALPPATSLAPDDGSLGRIVQRTLGSETANGAAEGVNQAYSSQPNVVGQIRQRIALIESCRLHVEQLLFALRNSLLRGLERQSSSMPVAYSSGENTATEHNFPVSGIKTVQARYNPNSGGAAKPGGGKAKGGSAEAQTPKGWGFSRITITITGFVIELFSYGYTYVFIIVFGFFTLYFRHYLNRN